MTTDPEVLRETYLLAQENNKMLHAMRRGAFIGIIVKIVLYIALIVGPLWFYAHYFAPLLGVFQQEVGTMRSAGGQTQTPLLEAQNAMAQLQHLFNLSGTTTHR